MEIKHYMNYCYKANILTERKKLREILTPGYSILLAKRIFCIYYIKNQQDATLAVLFISNCKINLHVSDAFCVHHQEY